MKKILLLAAAAVIGLTASAQFSNSGGSASAADCSDWNTVYLEYNPITLHSSEDGYSHNESFNGFSLGYSRAISLSKSVPIFIEVGGALQYSFKSKKEDDATNKINILSLKVPVNFMYKWSIAGNKVDLIPHLGLNMRLNLWGQHKITEDGESASVNIFNNDEKNMDGNARKRFQLGWQIGLKARFVQKFMVGVSYGTDFTDFYGNKDYHEKVRNANITLGYCF